MKNIINKTHTWLIWLFLLGTSTILPAQDLSHNGPVRRTLMTILLSPKYLTMMGLGILALILLKKGLLKGWVKVTMLSLAVFFFGVAANLPIGFFQKYAMHPSPICAVAKAMLYGFGTPMIATALVMLVLSLIGPRLFCGWVCPVGALQELTFMLQNKLKLPQLRLPYRLTNRIRTALLLAFFFLSGTAIIHVILDNGKKAGISLYDYFNAFHGFEWEGLALLSLLPLLLSVLLGLFVYRPYCHLVCPVGLLTHWLEPLALFRINLKKEGCNDCQRCVSATPCQATAEIVRGSTVRPDCFACGDCLSRCHNDSFEVSCR
jgi:polyferredoxin